MSEPAKTPEPPYYVVFFTSRRTPGDDGYGETSDRMEELAARQPGYLGVESARGADGLGITLSYWASEEAYAAWRAQPEHRVAQASGVRQWYTDYVIRYGVVTRDKHWEKQA